MSALSIEGLSYGFGAGAFALKDLDVDIVEGSFTVLLGPNGAGKTTLFNLVTRLFDAKDGTISIFGHDVRRQPLAALAAIGVVFQQPTLDLDLSVIQNLYYHGALHGLSRREVRRRAEAELGRLEMADRMSEKVRKLNGGHRRRVEIARALLHRPRLLLLDEPTVGLDVPARKAIVAHVHALAREQGLSVLWATHLIDEVEADDRLLVLHRGALRASGTVAEILSEQQAETVGDAFERLTAKAA
ncbi:MAG: ATP-binding cassette domain-containing protein [Alphaproteobacteria bacterium]